MAYKVIDDVVEAKKLYELGLLHVAVIRPQGGYTEYHYPIPKFYRPGNKYNFVPRKYAIQLEE